MDSQRISKQQFANNFLKTLPPELSLYILSIVDIESLCAASQTCKNWNNVIENTDYLWKLLCELNCEDWTDVVEDRASGYSWKETLQRNFKHHAIRRKWIRGDFSSFKSYEDLPGRIMCIMDRHQWGQIFEHELSR
ncbi:F-box only protein 48 [Strongylocentrotus purpuratus]|uniref:F-box domain-containing protein n=1 Tax=Strongylocentrotus purpuratus TaxID=7668 RepID=A0A7M7RE41_STRPU|nr:F-box only protein 48 [Strongylocentrotus purpuratus]|eukprot:XP_792991.1 PREDICTED: F-box only protein 48-like [Strongylocentrotus purpuratus]